MRKYNNIIIAIIVFFGLFYFIQQKNKKPKLAKQQLIQLFIDQHDYQNKILRRYENAFGTLSRIPAIKDETYFVKKTVATNTITFFTSQKEVLLSTAMKKLIAIIDREFKADELAAIVEARAEQKDLKTINPTLNEKVLRFYDLTEFKDAIKYPSLKMSEYYQHYLDEFRKSHNMKDGEFVLPK